MSPLLSQIIAELRFAHLAPFALHPLPSPALAHCSFILAGSTLLDVQIWHTKDRGRTEQATVSLGHGPLLSLLSPDARASSFLFQTHSRPSSAAAQGALPRCDAVRSDPSCSVYLQTGLICLLASELSPLNAALPLPLRFAGPYEPGLGDNQRPQGNKRKKL